MKKKIIHVDMDAFYVSVEIRDNPYLAGKPVAVGGPKNTRSVLSTCNYIAREFGVRSAMPSSIALSKCPDLIIVPGRMSVYQEINKHLHQIFNRYTAIIEGLSLDEAYLDVTDSSLFNGSATLIAQDIRKVIFEELALTASAGVAPLKYLAKIASDINKPDGQYVISPTDVIPFIETMRLDKISGVGKVSFKKLMKYGLKYGRDVRKSEEKSLKNIFGKLGSSLWLKCQGIDERNVEISRVRKSLGVEITLQKDIAYINQLTDVLHSRLIPELKSRTITYLASKSIKQLGVKIKFSDFQQTTKTCQFSFLDSAIFDSLLIDAVKRGNGKGVRLIGIHIGLEERCVKQQLRLF